jgi:hypothetical protein
VKLIRGLNSQLDAATHLLLANSPQKGASPAAGTENWQDCTDQNKMHAGLWDAFDAPIAYVGPGFAKEQMHEAWCAMCEDPESLAWALVDRAEPADLAALLREEGVRALHGVAGDQSNILIKCAQAGESRGSGVLSLTKLISMQV